MDNSTLAAIGAAAIIVAVVVWRLFFAGGSSATAAPPATGPKSKEEIARLLEAQGYQIKEIDFDDGRYEVEVRKDGEEYEIEVDPNTGAILKVEKD